MDISRISNYMGLSGVEDSKNKSDLSVNDFLQIMAAEIRNQNPMGSDGGGSKADYISQLAQFTTLEQLTEITQGLSLLTLMGQQQYSFSLVGKSVTVDTEDGLVSGVVDKVKFNNGIALLEINEKYYYLGSIVEVGENGVE